MWGLLPDHIYKGYLCFNAVLVCASGLSNLIGLKLAMGKFFKSFKCQILLHAKQGVKLGFIFKEGYRLLPELVGAYLFSNLP